MTNCNYNNGRLVCKITEDDTDPRVVSGGANMGGGAKMYLPKSTDGSNSEKTQCKCNCVTSIDSIDTVKRGVDEIKAMMQQLMDIMRQGLSQQPATPPAPTPPPTPSQAPAPTTTSTTPPAPTPPAAATAGTGTTPPGA